MGGIEGLPSLITPLPEVLPLKPKLPFAPVAPAVVLSETAPKDAQALDQARATIRAAIADHKPGKPDTKLQKNAQSDTSSAQAELETIEPESPILYVIKEMDQEMGQINEKAAALADKLKAQANGTISRIAQKFQDPAWREQASAYFANQSDKLAQGAENRWADSKVALIKLNKVSEQYITRLLTEGPMADIMGTIVENLLQKAIQLLPHIMELQTIPIRL